MKPLVLALACSICIAAAQYLWKCSIDASSFFVKMSLQSIRTLLLDFRLISGVCLYVVATAIWAFIVSRYSYYYVIIMIGFTVMLTYFVGILLLNEKVSAQALLGVLLLLLGVWLVHWGTKTI